MRPWERKFGTDTPTLSAKKVTQTLRNKIDTLVESEERARRNELRLRLALDAAEMICFEWDIVADSIRRFDPHTLEISLVQGQFNSFGAVKDAVHPEDRERFCSDIQRAMTNSDGHFESQIRVIQKDGSVSWFQERGKVEFDQNGRPVRLIGVAHDISLQKSFEHAQITASRRKDEFLATLAHELRNPLAAIRNGVHVLRHRELIPDRRNLRPLSIVERQIEHLIHLVDDLLEVSRITTGKIELKRSRVDLADVLRHAAEMAQPAIERGGHKLQILSPPSAILLDGDRVRLAQVFTNLLCNAGKYTEYGGRIWIAAERRHDQAIVTVRDTGVGIAPEMLPHVFDLFVQVERTVGRAHGGLGIGLTLVKKLVELHGGTIEARSEGMGYGSEFIIRLPIC